MNDFLRMCLNIITQIGPYLVVLLLLHRLTRAHSPLSCAMDK